MYNCCEVRVGRVHKMSDEMRCRGLSLLYVRHLVSVGATASRSSLQRVVVLLLIASMVSALVMMVILEENSLISQVDEECTGSQPKAREEASKAGASGEGTGISPCFTIRPSAT